VVPVKPLAKVLEENADAIIAGWLVLIRDAGGPLYANRPLPELYRVTWHGLKALIALLATGDDQQLHRHITGLVQERSLQGFQLAEVQRAFLNVKEVIWPLIGQTYRDRDDLMMAVQSLDMAMTHAMLEFSAAYETQVTQRLKELSITDALTGLYNRRYLDLILHNEMRRLTRSGEPLALVFLDIDFFKQYNDAQGHLHGDQALRIIGQVLRECVRAGDVVTRYGGEEFVVLLPQTSLAAATRVAERLRHAVAAAELPGHPAPQHRTISLGVACTAEPVSVHQLLQLADDAAYAAKRAGRNRVVVAGETRAAAS
jgi:diguanylate cyclase (GGDEF)-like protein